MQAGHMTSNANHVTLQCGQVTLVTKVYDNDVCRSTTINGDESNHYHGDESTPDDHCHGDNSATKSSAHCEVRDLHWLVSRMARLARYEAGKHPQQSLKVHNSTAPSVV